MKTFSTSRKIANGAMCAALVALAMIPGILSALSNSNDYGAVALFVGLIGGLATGGFYTGYKYPIF